MTGAAAGLELVVEGGGVDAQGGAPILDGLHLRVRSGSRVAVVGPSGAGKTTLLRLLGAARFADRGVVRLGAEDPSRLSASGLRRLRGRVGFVHQDHALVPNLRVLQNVLAGALGSRGRLEALRMFLAPRRPDVERAYGLLESLGVGDLLYQRTDRLSGGESQRVAVARALFQDAALLLADEPVASVDPARAREVLAVLLEDARRRGATLVASLHHVELLGSGFDRVLGLRGGRVVLDASPSDLGAAAVEELYRGRGFRGD
jgi:phosphonate transport system ATP-binding protein